MNNETSDPTKLVATKKLTLRDIADELGVSKATVSLAINGSDLVNEETRRKVLRKINELGYVYNRAAASLSTGQTRTVGLAVHDITNPCFGNVCASVEAMLSVHGRLAFLCNTDESVSHQRGFIEALAEHNADGLILCPAVGTDAEDLRTLTQRCLPAVLISRDVEDAGLDFVGNDDIAAFKLATEHLIGLGHRRIAMIGGGQPTSVSRNRRAGFYAAMEHAGLAVDPSLVVDCEFSTSGGEEALRTVMGLADPPTAVACFNDYIALGGISALYEMGLEPGRDLALVGCDGVDEGERAYARLTTVRVQKSAIGEIATEILLSKIDNPDAPVQRVIMKPELIVRKTCGMGNASERT